MPGNGGGRWPLVWVLALITAGQGWLGDTSAQAATKAFVIDGVPQQLEDVSNQVSVLYRSFRLNRTLQTWNVEAVLVNRSDASVGGPLLLLVEQARGTSGPTEPDGWDDEIPPRPYYDLSGQAPGRRLAPDSATQPRTLALGYTVGANPAW